MRIPIIAGLVVLLAFMPVLAGEKAIETPPAKPAAAPPSGRLQIDKSGNIHITPAAAGTGKTRAFQKRSMTSVIGSIAFWLVVLIGIIFLLVFAMKKLFGSARPSGVTMGRVIGRAQVTPKHQVVYLELPGRVIVLGVSGDRMTTLSEITDAADVDRMVAASHTSTSAIEKTFRRLFHREKEETAATPAPVPVQVASDDAKAEIDRVRRMVSDWQESRDREASA